MSEYQAANESVEQQLRAVTAERDGLQAQLAEAREELAAARSGAKYYKLEREMLTEEVAQLKAIVRHCNAYVARFEAVYRGMDPTLRGLFCEIVGRDRDALDAAFRASAEWDAL